ncbi:MAG: VCBS repeat-containing protein [bacterium]|nr:VCBS repeat-containing protein [bacterium]
MTTRIVSLLFALPFACLMPAAAAAQERYPAEPDLVEIMFIQESAVRLVGDVLVDHSGLNATAGVEELLFPRPHEWERLSPVAEPVLDQLEIEGELASGLDLYNLNNAYTLRFLAPQPDLWLLAADLEALPGIHLALPAPLPQELPLPPPYTFLQGYLNPAASLPSAGVDAYAAWTYPGGNGTGVTVCDLEYDWNYNHLDVTKAFGSQIIANAVDPHAAQPYPSHRHGTAVIGELVSDANGWGTTGVCPGASLLTCGTYYGLNPLWNVAGAITAAIAALQPGDVILLEQQWDYSGTANLGQFIPIEWWGSTMVFPYQNQSFNTVYAAIQTAVANGIHVVEAGGNGNLDTGALNWIGDSGAIVVGGGGTGQTAHGDRVRMGYSSYGPRFDLQGWGENVTTTGHNFDLYSAEGLNLHYTKLFSGTSSASPIVAGAVACLQGWWAGSGQTTPIAPALMRSTLKTTGTPQDSVGTRPIGPRPDLAAAIAALTPTASWVNVATGPLADTGLTNSVAWGDRDDDGDPDLYLVNFQSLCHYLENLGGGFFMDATVMPEANQAAGGAAAWGDADNDGDPDLYVGNYAAPNRLLRNDLLYFFDAFAMPESDAADAAGVSWIDYDNDGWLDLHVTTVNGLPDRLFRNMNGLPGPGGFVQITDPILEDIDDSRDGAWADYDGDGDQDLFLTKTTSGQPSRMLRNDAGTFVDAATPPLLDNGPSTGACWGDYDNDGDLDLYLVKPVSLPNRLLRNDGGGNFTDVSAGPLADTGGGMGACWGDYDNDGDLDLYVVNYSAGSIGSGINRLLRNDGGGVFTDDTSNPLYAGGNGHAAAFADYDRDGDLDLYLGNYGAANALFRNDLNNGNGWLHVKLEGTSNNASAVGARVTIWSPLLGMQMREVSDMTAGPGQGDLLVEFGLGGDAGIDSLRVDWPNGNVQRLPLTIAANQVVGVLDNTVTAVRGDDVPAEYSLHRAFPNPFNPATSIVYDVPRSGKIDLAIYDAGGRLLRRLRHGVAEPGRHTAVWDGRDGRGERVGAGLYFARLTAPGADRTLKLMLVK